MKKSKDLSDFFEKTGTYIKMSRIEQTKVNNNLNKQNENRKKNRI